MTAGFHKAPNSRQGQRCLAKTSCKALLGKSQVHDVVLKELLPQKYCPIAKIISERRRVRNMHSQLKEIKKSSRKTPPVKFTVQPCFRSELSPYIIYNSQYPVEGFLHVLHTEMK